MNGQHARPSSSQEDEFASSSSKINGVSTSSSSTPAARLPLEDIFLNSSPHNPSGRPSWLQHLPPGPKETPTQSIRKKHKSVRSLTKAYEQSSSESSPNNPTTSSSTTSSPSTSWQSAGQAPLSSSSSDPDDPFNSRPNQTRKTSNPTLSNLVSSSPSRSSSGLLSSPASPARVGGVQTPTSSGPTPPRHSRRSSVLLASGSYPSTLASDVQQQQYPSHPPPVPSAPPHFIPRSFSGGTVAADPASPARSAGLRTQTTTSPATYSTMSTGLPTVSVSVEGNENIPIAGEPTTPSKSLGRSRSHGHYTSPRQQQDEWSPVQGNRVVSGSSSIGTDAEADEAGDGLGDLMRSQSTSARKPISQMTPAERREHSRKHSRVHSRNLSVFFPQPGTAAEQEADSHRVQLNYANDGNAGRPDISLDTAGLANGPSSLSSAGSTSPTQSRRGHHSKHSVSHAMMPSTLASRGMNRDVSAESFASAGVDTSPVQWRHSEPAHHEHTGHHHHHHHDAHEPAAHTHDHHSHAHHHHDHSHATTTSSSLPYPFSLAAGIPPLPRRLLPTFVFSVAHFLLGSSLWVAGQSSDSLSVSGLGYLVVFDSLGVFNEVLASWISDAKSRQQRKRVSHAFSTQRISTLLNFVQTIYLLFAAVYVCKESIEHALLEGGEESLSVQAILTPANGTDVGGGSALAGGLAAASVGSGHHHHSEETKEVELPLLMLILSTAACLFSNFALGNHAKLVAASGMSTTAAPSSTPSRRHSRSQSVLVSTANLAGPLLSLLSNPFTLTVLFFSTTLLFSAVTMSPFQVAALDKVLAGLESVTMWYIALPASKVLGKVLLQTAPNTAVEEEGGRTQTVQLMRALEVLQHDPLIEAIDAPHLWQLTPSTSAIAPSGASSLALSSGDKAKGSRTAKAPCLIASVRIHLHEKATDEDVLNITKLAYERCAPSVGAGMGVQAGQSLRGSLLAGELVIDVKRRGYEPVIVEGASCGHDHSHEHHDHSHSHEGHAHHHDHGQSHSHEAHSHSHEAHGHSHSHEAHSHSKEPHSHSHDSHGHSHSHEAHGHAHNHEPHSHGSSDHHTHTHTHHHHH